MFAKVLVVSIVSLCTLLALGMFGYMIYEYLIHPGGPWHVLNGTSDSLIEWLPLYLHMIGASILIILGPIQLLRGLCKMRWHKYTGGAYVFGAVLNSFGGIFFMNFNQTVGGPGMTTPFTVYGMLVFIYAMITMTLGLYKHRILHSMWVFRMYFLGIASVFYRGLYIIAYFIRGHHHITFHEPIDMAFNWLFFIIPMFMTEMGLLIYYHCPLTHKRHNISDRIIIYDQSSPRLLLQGEAYGSSQEALIVPQRETSSDTSPEEYYKAVEIV